jgi:hypothetical protein
MSRRTLGIAALAALVVLSSVAAVSAWTVRVQSLYAWVEGINTDHEEGYNIKPAEAIPVQVGEEVEVSLWATTGGEDEWVSASYSVAAGRDKIQITGVTEDGVRVRIKGGSGGVAQLGYEVEGDYAMAGGLRQGRITFEIE